MLSPGITHNACEISRKSEARRTPQVAARRRMLPAASELLRDNSARGNKARLHCPEASITRVLQVTRIGATMQMLMRAKHGKTRIACVHTRTIVKRQGRAQEVF